MCAVRAGDLISAALLLQYIHPLSLASNILDFGLCCSPSHSHAHSSTTFIFASTTQHRQVLSALVFFFHTLDNVKGGSLVSAENRDAAVVFLGRAVTFSKRKSDRDRVLQVLGLSLRRDNPKEDLYAANYASGSADARKVVTDLREKNSGGGGGGDGDSASDGPFVFDQDNDDLRWT